ncbi:MAG: hypothetical protein HN377_12105, partial [Alphaproteobacteria bacterium]|nr:hypothetical protein [Alphaproteobacteria bacterium]
KALAVGAGYVAAQGLAFGDREDGWVVLGRCLDTQFGEAGKQIFRRGGHGRELNPTVPAASRPKGDKGMPGIPCKRLARAYDRHRAAVRCGMRA